MFPQISCYDLYIFNILFNLINDLIYNNLHNYIKSRFLKKKYVCKKTAALNYGLIFCPHVNHLELLF